MILKTTFSYSDDLQLYVSHCILIMKSIIRSFSPFRRFKKGSYQLLSKVYSKTCVRQPPLKLTLVVDVERWLSYKVTCHVILLAKLHDMYLYKTFSTSTTI